MNGSVKEFLKTVLARVAPVAYTSITSRRARARNQALEVKWGCAAVTEKVLARSGPQVQGGPFKGLELPPRTFRRHIVPKLVGCYEMELHAGLESLLATSYRQVVDVGCAEGYYAVGLARRMPDAIVHAFDTDIWARRTIKEMAQKNGITNLKVHGACTPEWLSAHLLPDTLLVSDCEGYEDVLLVPDEVPALAQSDLIVETHEEQSPGVGRRLIERFERTHLATVVKVVPREPERYAALSFLAPGDRSLAVADIRPDDQEWLILQRRQPR